MPRGRQCRSRRVSQLPECGGPANQDVTRAIRPIQTRPDQPVLDPRPHGRPAVRLDGVPEQPDRRRRVGRGPAASRLPQHPESRTLPLDILQGVARGRGVQRCRPPTGSAPRAGGLGAAIIRSTLSMILLGRGMTPRRPQPGPLNGLVSSSARVRPGLATAGRPSREGASRESQKGGGKSKPREHEPDRDRDGPATSPRALTEATTEIAAAASRGRSEPPRRRCSTSPGSTPPRNTIKIDEWANAGGQGRSHTP